MKRLTVSCLMICACLGLMCTGCKKNETEDNTELELVEMATGTELETETEEPAKRLEGRNLLTGEPMEEEKACMRPLAVMLGNTVDALPQYGVGQADVLYEVPVEGGLTRLMAIFQDYTNLEALGSVRSCRHYFAYYAMEFDAIYMHYGQAPYAEPLLESGKVSDLNGLDSKVDSLTFYRESSRKQPHNAFATSKGIADGIAYKGFETKYQDNYTGHYLFAADGETVELKDGEAAQVVCPGFAISKPWFVYNEEDGLYYRYQYKDKHIDGADNEQLAFKNIIFQYSSYGKAVGANGVEDTHGYLDIRTTGEGSGKYITNGKAIDITWKKADENSPARYYDADGNEITLNQGKTSVSIVLNDAVKRVGIYASEAEYEEAKAAN